jgi:glycosyltransferase involved in cell wall biosynthesis
VLYDDTLAANPAGTGTYVRGLRDALKARPDLELETSAFSSPSLGALDTGRKGVAARLRNSLRHLNYYWNVLPRRARATGCDLIFCPSALVPLRGRTPFVMTVYDLTVRRYPQTVDTLSRLYTNQMLRTGLRRARALCTISAAVAAEIREVAGTRVAPTYVAYPGPSPELVEAAPAAVFSNDHPFLLMVGTLEPRKNHVTALRALAQYGERPRGPNLELVLAGSSGWHYGEVLRTIDELGLQDRVRRIGPVASGSLKWLYQHALALLFPSLYEGFGLPVLEAMTLECPVLASQIPSVIEITGVNAWLLPPTDVAAWSGAIAQLASGSPDRTALTAALTRASRFTWEACAASAVQAIRAALSTRLVQ